jgi:hypothetical protein
MQPQNSQSEAGSDGSSVSFVRAGLTECEAVIDRGLEAFVEVGGALLRIRDERLYRESHGTFEDYCRERWGLSRSRTSQLMDAANVSTIVDIPSEGVARELAPLRDYPEQLRAKWREAVEKHGRPTANQVREVVAPKRPLKAKPELPDTLDVPLVGRNLQVAEKAKLRLERVIGTCNGLASGLPYLRVEEAVKVCEPHEIKDADAAASDAIAALGTLRERLITVDEQGLDEQGQELERPRRDGRSRTAEQQVRGGINALIGMRWAFASIDPREAAAAVDEAEVIRWKQELTAAMKTLRAFRSVLHDEGQP